MSAIYHFTNTARLPRIVLANELRPGRNQIGNYPCDFVWATTNSLGDRSSAALQGYHEGQTALVRLSLHAEDFELWPDILRRFPQWTAQHVERLEANARKLGETGIHCWRVRAEPLPLSRAIRVEAKHYSGDWRAIDVAAACVVKPALHLRGVVLGDNVFAAMQRIEPGQRTMYATWKLSAQEWNGL